jgi:ATP-dependent Lhr-like helicase
LTRRDLQIRKPMNPHPDPLAALHPAVAGWFRATFAAPTPAQEQAWPAIQSGRHALIAAPTGSGKTLAAFLAAIDALVRRGIEAPLPDETAIVYVSPLKALSNDVQINLEGPLAGIRAELEKLGLPDVDIRTMVRTGDTPQGERIAMRKRPPHIVVTTPESLYVLLGSASGRAMLATTQSVIVDEIHAVAGNKRGSHLALSLERLQALCGRSLVRIGLSATQKPIDEVARFLTGSESSDCEIVDVGYTRQRDLAIEMPPAPLEAVMSGDVWQQVYTRLAELIEQHRTTLVFVNTRRMAERAARHLSERLGKDAVAAHHGSLARELRLDAEQRLKRGELKVLVATASLELGIDIGDVDLVCQLGSPRSIAGFLQRVGRSGHAVGGTPKGRLFPQSRDDLVECGALLDAVRRGELDTLCIERNALDVLAQQIVAEVSCREWDEQELFDTLRRAYPYASLTREDYTDVVRMLAEGYSTRRGPRSAYLHRDAVNGMLRARRGARLTAITSGGAIPDTADYDVVLEPQAFTVGRVHEDFAVESIAGDIFQLGNTSYRILRVERGRLRVEDAKGMPPTIPFWLGEAPGRSNELSFAVSRLRGDISNRIDGGGAVAAESWLRNDVRLGEPAARQLVDYLAAAKIALGVLPTQHEMAMERFFDESGGTQLIVHSPWGSRLNRAWGLALRKRFCRSFNFELQAAATDDAIVLSLSTSHSFPLADVAKFLHSNTVREVLVQALLDAPMFPLRWRWNATTSLALPRFVGGKKVPPQLQRMKSEDLLATVFPDQVACAENLVGERQIPDHPLVAQTLHDCLDGAMDIAGLENLLRALESGEARIVARDLTAPSPLAAEILGARPYAFLDDAPLEERRTQAVQSRRWSDPESADDLGRLDADAIAAVREEAWPEARDADELHDALMGIAFLTDAEAAQGAGWNALLMQLVGQRRATQLRLGESPALWVAAERLPQFQALHPHATFDPAIVAPAEFAEIPWTREEALVDILRARLTGLGPTTVDEIGASLMVAPNEIELALLRLEADGHVMRGKFAPDAEQEQWCERHLLARIHRYTLGRLRREIEPVEPRDFMRFLFDWQRVAQGSQGAGPDTLAATLAQLEGYEAAAGAWESELLPARVADYDIAWLDELSMTGRIVWTRLRAASQAARTGAAGPLRSTPIVLLPRQRLALWTALTAEAADTVIPSSRAQLVADWLRTHGASFFDELVDGTRLLRTELENALAELVAFGLINADSFAGLRALLTPASKRPARHHRSRRPALWGIQDAGRWAMIRKPPVEAEPDQPKRGRGESAPETLEHIARTLLRRYGVVAWRVLEREAAWLPPWRELRRVYHRLEARGEIRGGRFIAGIAGEQFALPEAIGLLRSVRQRSYDGSLVCVSGSDPLNQLGTLLPGPRLPALTGARVLYRDGVPIATLVAGDVALLEPMDESAAWIARKQLLRDHAAHALPADADIADAGTDS